MMMLISPPAELTERPARVFSSESTLETMFSGVRPRNFGTRNTYVAPALACSSCMSTLTEDALCAECGKEFEP